MKIEGALPCEMRVQDHWLDSNRHMNVTSYPAAFAAALDVVMDGLDLGQAYSDRTECSFFAVESHIIYERELLAGDLFVVTFQLLARDHKRIHYLQRMYQAEAGYLASTNEQMLIHVNLTTRRTQPLSAE